MKRLIKILSVTTICLLLVFGCFACNGHVHTFDKDTWASNETTHWHPATCEHTDEKDSEAAHADGNNDGKCDVCQKEMPSTNPPSEHTHEFDMSKWESDETTHWHPATCGHPEQKNSEAAHIDEDEDGKCDVCQKDMPSTTPPEHTHEFDMNKWESDGKTHWHPADCDDPTHRGNEAEHIDEDNNNECDVCGRKLAAFYTETVGKIIDKIATGKNFTLTLNAKINGTDNSLSFKFAENGFDCPTFKSKELHDEEGNLVGIVRTTISMRDNSIYVLDATYDVNDGTEAKEPSTKILNKIALPEEIKELGSLPVIIKNFIKTQLADVDLTFLNFEETDNGYELYCDTDIAEILNLFVPYLLKLKDMSLNDIISQLLAAVMGAEDFDLAETIKTVANMLKDKTVGEIVTLLNTFLPVLVEGTTLDSLIDTVVTALGINITPQSIYAILGKLGLGIPEPTEGDTLGAYIVKVLQSGKIGAIKVDDIVKKITGDETATLESVLTKLADTLENTSMSDLLSFIPFDALQGMNFTQFKLYLKLDVDKEYAIQSLVAGLEGKYTSATVTEEKQLELSCGLTISDRGTTELSVLETALLDNNLKFADDNVLDSTILTTVVKALAKKYIGGTISIDELKTYYTKIVTLVKSSSLNEKVFTNLGFEKSQPDENGNYVLSRHLLDLLPIITPLVESLSPAMIEGLEAIGQTVTDPLSEAPFLFALFSLIDIDMGEGLGRETIIPLLIMIVPQLEIWFDDSVEEEDAMNLQTIFGLLSFFGGGNIIDTACDFLGVSMDSAYKFFKEKYDENLTAPLADETISAYLARCILDGESEFFSEKLGKVTLNRLLSDISGSDFYTWYHENVQTLINFMLLVSFRDINALDLELLITVDENNVIQSIELAICYGGHAKAFDEGDEEQDLTGKFSLLKFTARA